MNLTKAFHEKVRNEMKKHRSKKHFSKQDVERIVKAKQTGDWSEVYESKLYIVHGGEYCSMLEVLNYLKA